MNDTVAIVMAGNNGYEIGEITANRSVGAVPFASRYRTIDFILSNVVNSRIERVGVATQTQYRSLMDHIGSGAAWDLSRKRYGLHVLPPYVGKGIPEVQGDIDILNGIKDYLEASGHEFVLLTGSDLVFNCTFDFLAEEHKKSGADVTVMYNVDDEKILHHVGIKTDSSGRVTDIEINPERPTTNKLLMGVYYMKKEFLQAEIDRCLAHDKHDFVRDVLLAKKDELNIHACEFDGYVGRIHDVNSYFLRNMEMLDTNISAKLFDAPNPVHTKVKDQVPTIYGEKADVKNSIIADGCVIRGTVKNSILFRGVRVEEGTTVENSIIMQNSCIENGALLEYTVLDKGVLVGKNKKLIGQENFPIVVGKNAEI